MNRFHSKLIIFILFFIINIFPVVGLAQNLTNDTLSGSALPSGTNIINDQNFSNGSSLSTGNSVVSQPVIINDSPTQYRPITPGGSSFFGGAGFEEMLQKIFTIAIYFTVILSVLMIIYGGLEYMGSESVFKKGQGRERIFAALMGLLVALVSILIIATILPGYQGNVFRINIFNE
jgi:hypothetical protein